MAHKPVFSKSDNKCQELSVLIYILWLLRGTYFWDQFVSMHKGLLQSKEKGKSAHIFIVVFVVELRIQMRHLLDEKINHDFLRTVSSINLIFLKIQIVGRNLSKNLGFKSPSGKVKFFCPISFHFHILHKKLNIDT